MNNTDFLFARPSFLDGVASTIDLFGVLQEFNKSPTPEQADAWALWNDFKTVGNDLRISFKQYREALDSLQRMNQPTLVPSI